METTCTECTSKARELSSKAEWSFELKRSCRGQRLCNGNLIIRLLITTAVKPDALASDIASAAPTGGSLRLNN